MNNVMGLFDPNELNVRLSSIRTVSSFWKISSLASVIRVEAVITALILSIPFMRSLLESVRPKELNRCQWHISLPNLFSVGFEHDLV